MYLIVERLFNLFEMGLSEVYKFVYKFIYKLILICIQVGAGCCVGVLVESLCRSIAYIPIV